MNKLRLGSSLALLLMAAMPAQTDTTMVVITHSNVPLPDATTLQKVYTGRQIEINGVPVTPANARAGMAVRERFLRTYLNQDDDKYVAYWTVRRYIGKGVPPREIASASEMISFVQSTPGAIGYVEASEVKPGVNVQVVK
jgi:hypothetical protein